MPATLADIQAKYGKGILPMYKEQMYEPFMENDNGVGYQGVVMYRKDIDAIQCSVCGSFMKKISSSHLKTHNLTSDQYRIKFGLFKKIALISKGLSKKLSKISSLRARNINHKLWEYSKSITSIKTHKNSINRARKIAQFLNKHNLCDAQIENRLSVVKYLSKKVEITSSDVYKHDRNLYDNLCKRHEGVENFCKLYKIITNDENQLISLLRNSMYLFKKMPTLKEISEIINIDLIYKHFGSWSRAKMMAGLDQLLEEVKNDK
jgi:hypothetical protein